MTVVDQPASDPRIKHRNASSTSSAQSSSKTAKYSARNEARADRLPDAGNSLEERSNLMKQPDRRCTTRSKRN